MQRRSFRRGHGGHTQGGLHALLLETVGAKSGETRTAMVGYVEEPAGTWLIVGSMAGAAYHPKWIYNLAKNPDAAIEFGDGRRVNVRAATLAGSERDAAWKLLEREAPEYPAYLTKTDREIPIVRLTPR
jgi:deazaflavin-dependent oxidoreductase (nitroreductase family)